MNKDLVKLLRERSHQYVDNEYNFDKRAADRIEKLVDELHHCFHRINELQAALRDILDERGICGHCGQLATGEGKRSFVICDKTVLGFKGPCHWTPQDPKDIARKALEGKDD